MIRYLFVQLFTCPHVCPYLALAIWNPGLVTWPEREANEVNICGECCSGREGNVEQHIRHWDSYKRRWWRRKILNGVRWRVEFKLSREYRAILSIAPPMQNITLHS
jgi:hypothetical protein